MNLTHPALPDYTGPDHGLAGLVHHDTLYEYCWSFSERIRYIRAEKPAHELATRARCLVYLDPTGQPWEAAWAAYDKALQPHAAWTALDTARAAHDTAGVACDKALAACDKALAAYDKALAAYDKALAAYDKARAACDKALAACDKALQPHAAAIEAQIQALVPDLPWDGTRLVFGETA